jgi:hypothetical protein
MCAVTSSELNADTPSARVVVVKMSEQLDGCENGVVMAGRAIAVSVAAILEVKDVAAMIFSARPWHLTRSRGSCTN